MSFLEKASTSFGKVFQLLFGLFVLLDGNLQYYLFTFHHKHFDSTYAGICCVGNIGRMTVVVM